MIKKLICVFFLSLIVIFSVAADNVSMQLLRSRLNKLNNLYVLFVQKISNSDGYILEEYKGELWIKRPNLFHWHVQYPEEIFLISDGKTLWYYLPIIKQVTVCWINDSNVDNIFKILLSYDSISIWNDYNISQKGDCFFLKPICNNNFNIKNYIIKVTNDGVIKQFSVVELDGKFVHYYLSEHNYSNIDVARFYFDIPKDVQLDDQRK